MRGWLRWADVPSYLPEHNGAVHDGLNPLGMRLNSQSAHMTGPALQEALSMGIPKSALPKLSQTTSAEELQEARVRLSGMIASFMSSGL